MMGPINKQRWIYASGKQLLERVVHAHGMEGSLDYTIVRPFNFVGPRFDYLVPSGSMGGPRLFAHYMSALLSGGPMFLVDGGWRHRSFTHIADACDLYEEQSGLPARREFIEVDGETFYGNGYEDVDRVPPSIDKIRALGWEPRHGLRDIFGDAMAYYLETEQTEQWRSSVA
jgi:UDP-apiose/xylose synthase